MERVPVIEPIALEKYLRYIHSIASIAMGAEWNYFNDQFAEKEEKCSR